MQSNAKQCDMKWYKKKKLMVYWWCTLCTVMHCCQMTCSFKNYNVVCTPDEDDVDDDHDGNDHNVGRCRALSRSTRWLEALRVELALPWCSSIIMMIWWGWQWRWRWRHWRWQSTFFGGFCEFDFVHAGVALVGASILRPQMSGLKPKNWSAFTDLIFINLGQQWIHFTLSVKKKGSICLNSMLNYRYFT